MKTKAQIESRLAPLEIERMGTESLAHLKRLDLEAAQLRNALRFAK